MTTNKKMWAKSMHTAPGLHGEALSGSLMLNVKATGVVVHNVHTDEALALTLDEWERLAKAFPKYVTEITTLAVKPSDSAIHTDE